MKDSKDENELLLETIKKFMADEIYPHEEAVDKLGYVPTEIANQIEKKSKEIGLFAANLPIEVGGGGLDYESMALVEREYGKTSHALHSWIARPTEIYLPVMKIRKSSISILALLVKSVNFLLLLNQMPGLT